MILGRLRNAFNELGPLNGALYLTGQVLQKLTAGKACIIRYAFFAQHVPSNPASASRPSAKLTVRQVGADDTIVTSFPRPSTVIARRFASGDTCFVAESGARFAGFLWIARNAYEEDEVRCRYELSPQELCAWDYDVYVEPDFRIGRCFSRLWEAANTHLAGDGIRWSLSRISAFNPSSLAAHRRLGIQHITSATFIVLGPAQVSFLGRPPFLHLSARRHARPVLTLSPPAGTRS